MKAKLTYLGAGIGLIAGFILYLISDFFLFLVILGPMVGFLSYDYRLYRKQKLKLEEEAKKAQEEQLKKEQKRLEREMKKTTKKEIEKIKSHFMRIFTL